MNQRILRRPSVEAVTGLSRSSIYERLNPKSEYFDPNFPKPIKLGKRAVGWRESDVAAWLESRSGGEA
jgi:prophage regulatory protein